MSCVSLEAYTCVSTDIVYVITYVFGLKRVLAPISEKPETINKNVA